MTHAVTWQNGVLTDLGTLPGLQFSYATSMNNTDQVIGVSDANGANPFIWQNGQMTALNSLLPPGSPWTILSVWGINDHDQIVGLAFQNGSFASSHGVLITIPEPPTFVLAAIGLAALAAWRWRRRSPA